MIRQATTQDRDRLMQLAEEMHQESRYSKLPISREKLSTLFSVLLSSPSHFLRVVAVGEDLVGFMAGYVTEHFASRARVAGEYGLYITKSHRGGIKAVRLLREYQEWAKAQGAELIHAGVTTGVHTESTVAFYEALGYKPVGVVFDLGN